MTRLDVKVIAAVIRLFPRSFRDRFADEMLAAYLDQRDAITAQAARPSAAVARHFWLTTAGLLRALVPVRLDERRRHQRPDHSPAPRSTRMRNVLRDARHAVRVLRTKPGFAAVAVITLALGIGANTAVFSVVNSVILAPLPYDEPEQLVRIYSAYPTDAKQFLTGYDILDVRDEVKAFASTGIFYSYREIGGDITTPNGPAQRIRVLPVSADYFRTLRATPLLGRTFTRDEERADAQIVILSHRLWTTHVARDPNVIGRSIDLNGVRYEIVGVMRPTFADLVGSDVVAWIPPELRRGVPRAPTAIVPGSNNRQNHYLSAIARLAPGVSVAQAQAQVDAIMTRLKAEFPQLYETRRLRVAPLHEDMVGESKTGMYILMGSAALVLLIACLNVANLFLVRGLAQLRETAIRTALGAARARLVGKRLTESLVVAVAGGIVGTLIAYLGVKALLAVSPESLPRSEEVGFDLWLLGFALLVTVVTGVLFGTGPALRASRANPADAMHDGSRGTTGGRRSSRIRGVLVASQISLALMLLVGAGVLIRAFVAEQRRDLGFDAARVLTFEVHLPALAYSAPERRVLFHQAYISRLQSLPGVTRAGVTSWLPANGDYHIWGYEYLNAAGEEKSAAAQVRVIDGSFFGALGIPLLRGRGFGPTDGPDGAPVGIISQSLAKEAYGDGDPIGKKFRTSGSDWTVIGVVGDVVNQMRSTRGPGLVYLTHQQFAANRNWAMTYVVQSAAGEQETIASARRELGRIDPALVLYRSRPMESVLAVHRARDRFILMLMATFGAIALTLAAVGVYGVLSYSVTQRTREIGVRMALGAQPMQVRAIVLAQGMIVAGIGIVIGAAGAFALARVLQSLAVGINPRDPLVFSVATAVLCLVVVVAGYLPARRATRVDPLEALRSD